MTLSPLKTALALGVVLLLGMQSAAEAAQLQSLRITETAKLQKIQPDWPVPGERNQVFYIQRSSNSNTVVYTVRFDSAGNLDRKNPVAVYWRRYNTNGARKALKYIEAAFAYGVKARPRDTAGAFDVTLKSLPQIPMLLRQTGPGTAELLVRIGGRTARPVYGYVQLDESGLIPKVTGLFLHGIDLATGRALTEEFTVSGGAILK